MSDPKRPCDLCGLPVGAEPHVLREAGNTLQFCCEGCRGIYQMVHGEPEEPRHRPETDRSSS